MSVPKQGDPREIGFGQDVVVAGRRFHVQTEVIGRSHALVVKSTVHENGVVRHVVNEPYPRDVIPLDEARKIVEAQHQRVLSQVAEGLIG